MNMYETLDAEYFDEEIAKLIIKDNNKSAEKNIHRAIHSPSYRVSERELEIALTLLQYDNDIRNKALILSIKKNRLDFVKHLVEKEVNIYENEHNALFFSAENCYLEIVEYLLSFYKISKAIKIIKNYHTMMNILLKKDISKYPLLIQFYRELGIDLFDMIEKEY